MMDGNKITSLSTGVDESYNEYFLDSYDIEGMYRDEIKELDEAYSKVKNLDDIPLFEEEIEKFRWRNNLSVYSPSFFRNLLVDNVTIFLVSRYKDKLSDRFLFDNMLLIYSNDNYKKYIENNDDRLRLYVTKIDFSDEKRDDGKVLIPLYFRGDNAYYFYNQYKDVLNLSIKGWDDLFVRFSDEQLYSAASEIKCGDSKTVQRLLSSPIIFRFLSDRLSFVNYDIYDLYIECLKNNAVVCIDSVIDAMFSEQSYRKILGDNDFDKNYINSFKYQYYYKLNYLQKLSFCEREKHMFFDECYKIFVDIMKARIKDLNDDDNEMLKQLLNRIIDGESFLLITSIDNKASLCLYYKTNFYFENINNIDFRLINELSLEQWMKVKDNYLSLDFALNLSLQFRRRFALEDFNVKYIPYKLVDFTCKMGYDFVSKFFDRGESAKRFIFGSDVMVLLAEAYDEFNIPNYEELLKSFLLNVGSFRFDKLKYCMEIFKEFGKNKFLYFDLLKDNRLIKLDCVIANMTIEQYLRSGIKNKKDLVNTDNLAYQYFYKISYLNELSKKERESHPFYDECYKIFVDIMKNRIADLTDDDMYIIRKLFHRILNGASFVLITSINNKASLYLYYKTNFYFENNTNVDYKMIDDISYKQWSYIREAYSSFVGETDDDCIYIDYSYIPSSLVDFVCKFGYEFALELDKKGKDAKTFIFKKLSLIMQDGELFKKTDYVEKLRCYLLDLLDSSKLEEVDFKRYFDIFNYLYKNNYSKLTFKAVKLISTDISPLLFPNNYHIKDNLNKLDFVAKGDPYVEKAMGMVLYNRYRRRIHSSIPNYEDTYNGLESGTVDMHDVNIITNGIGKYIYPEGKLASSCLTPAGKAASCLEHGAVNPNGRFFYVKKDGKIIAYSWMWRVGNVLCFDNIELTEDYLHIDNNEETIYNIYMQAAKSMVYISKNNEDTPITTVVLGRNPIDVANSYLEKLDDVQDKYGDLFKPLDSDKLYMVDSSKKQLVLVDGGGDVSVTDVEPVYLAPRGQVRKLEDDMSMVNAIYFDYCLEHCIKYSPLSRFEFKAGYIGDDWFYGEKTDGSTVLYDVLDDVRRKDEIKKYISGIQNKDSSICIVKSKIDRLNYLLDNANYSYDRRELDDYLTNITTCMKLFDGDYFHSPGDIYRYMQIVMDGKISSAHVRGTSTYGVNNGKYFISVAKIDSDAFRIYSGYLGFLLDKDIMVFNTEQLPLIDASKVSFMKNCDYCIRPTGLNGEFQAYGSIELDKVKAVTIPKVNLNLGKVIYIAEECGFDFPVVCTGDRKLVDNNHIKKIIRVK